jgi:hypothetical protein
MKAIELAQKQTNDETAATHDAVAMIHAMTLETNDDQIFAAEVLADIKARFKAIEKKRKAITTPLMQAKKEVDDLFRPLKTRLEECEYIIKAKIAAYQIEKQAANEEALAVIAGSDDIDEAAAILTTIEPVELPKGVHVRHIWDAEVINQELLMPQFLMPNMAAIKEYAAEHTNEDGSPASIPGVKFTRRDVVVQRTT